MMIENKRLADRVEQAWSVRMAHFSTEIGFDYPVDTALISVSGDQCELNCAHCGGHYLKHMRPAWDVGDVDAPSYLISGGCDARGQVPVTSHLEQMAALRAGKVMNWHVGFIGREEIEAIAPYVDLISFDFVGDVDTAREVYGLDKTLQDYVGAYRLLKEYVRVIPHLTIGLRGGQISGEHEALRALSGLDVEELVLLVLIPTPGTRYADRQPPSVETVAGIMAEARLLFPQTPINLGCMRPHGEYRAKLDVMAVKCGLNKIVSPAREAVRLSEELGLQIVHTRECCAI
jgi:uncharacterized radical SAM superfamily protein